MTYRADIEKILGGLPSPLDRPLRVTLFTGANGVLPKHAPQGVPKTLTVRGLERSIRTIAAREKDHLPLIALARFEGDYRNADNVATYSGGEGDYDAEIVAPEEASRRLTAAGVAHLIYTSPSHTPERPRWRVFCPFSRDLTPEERDRALARVNGVLGGILAEESFDRGRSYYIGHVARSTPTILFGEGDYVDRREDLDSGSVGKIQPDRSGKATKPEGVDKSDVLLAIAGEHVRRGLTKAEFERAAMADPHARAHVENQGSAKNRQRALDKAWKKAERTSTPYFGDIAGATPGGGDIENAIAFAARYEGAYLHVGKEWLRWDGARWAPCSRGEHMEAAQTLAGELMKAAASEYAERNNDTTKARLSRAKATYEDHRKLRGMLELAKSKPGIVATLDMFDTDPMQLGVRNGVLDLRTGELIEPRPDMFVCKQAGAEFDPRAKCPRWDRFLLKVLPDRDVREFVQRAAGYTLTGLVDEEIFVFMRGSGANGKSVLANVLAAILGDYAKTLDKAALIKTKHESEYYREKARLPGTRLALINETRQGDIWDDAKIKELASREAIPMRLLYREGDNFMPSHCLWIRGNHAPGAHDAGDAFWRRIVPVTFGVQIPPSERVSDLDRRIIREESAGVLNWLVEGCLEWQRGGLRIPASIEAERTRYRASTDILGQWLEQRTQADPNARLPVSEAFADYQQFCTANGVGAGMQRGFSESMAERGFTHKGSRRDGRNFGGLRIVNTRFEG